MWTVAAQHGNFDRVIKRFHSESEAITFCEDRDWQYYYCGLTARLAIRCEE